MVKSIRATWYEQHNSCSSLLLQALVPLLPIFSPVAVYLKKDEINLLLVACFLLPTSEHKWTRFSHALA